MTRFLVALVLVGAALSCTSRELTRARAKELLLTTPFFREMATYTLKTGRQCGRDIHAERDKKEPTLYLIFRAHQGGGLIRFKFAELIEVDGPHFATPGELNAMDCPNDPTNTLGINPSYLSGWIWTTTVTEKGRAKGLSPSGGQIDVASRHLAEVTGVTGGSGESLEASVEFKWAWLPTAPFREDVSGAFDETAGYASTVLFRLYDDGWRYTGCKVTHKLTLAPRQGARPVSTVLSTCDPRLELLGRYHQ